jgi:MFS family permease
MNPKESTVIWTRNFTLLCLANLLLAIAFYFLLPTLPLFLVDELHADKGMVGIILALFTVSSLIVRPFAGFFIDRQGRKGILLISLALFSLLFILYAVALNLPAMFLLRFVHGLTWGVLTVALSTILVDLIPPLRRGEGLGYFGLSMTLAMSVGPLIGLLIMGEKSYSIMFLVAGILSLGGFILTILVKYTPDAPAPPNRPFAFRHLVERKSLPISVNVLIITLTYGGLVSFIALYANEIGVSNAGFFFMVFALGIGISRLNTGKIFDLKGPRMITSLGILLLILGFPVLAWWKSVWGFLISAILLGTGYGAIMPIFQAMVNNLVPPHSRAKANATYFTGFEIGIALGMLLIGLFSERIQLTHSYLIFSLVNIGALLFFIFYVNKHYEKNKVLK